MTSTPQRSQTQTPQAGLLGADAVLENKEALGDVEVESTCSKPADAVDAVAEKVFVPNLCRLTRSFVLVGPAITGEWRGEECSGNAFTATSNGWK